MVDPAATWLGDLAMFPSADGMGSLFIVVSPRKLLGWREDYAAPVVIDVEPGVIVAVWRV